MNGIPWSRQTIKRKSTKTMFQPIIQTSGTNNSDRKINLLIRHTKSALVCFSKYPKISYDNYLIF
jgi:BioD-like phosphotransacetylase family protein